MPASLASKGGQYDPITAVDADQHEIIKKQHPTQKGKFYEYSYYLECVVCSPNARDYVTHASS